MSLKFRKFIELNKNKLPEGYYRDKKTNQLRMKRVFSGKSLTQQHNKEAADINNILKKHKFQPIKQPEYTDDNYGDFSNVPNYQDSLQIVIDADTAYAQLPANIRKEMRDPRGMIQFCEDPRNYDKALELGLVDAKPIIEPQKVQIVDSNGSSAKKVKGNQQTAPTGEGA